MICTQCGSDNAEGNKFCSSCGAKLTEIEDVKPEISLDTAASDILEGNSPAEETVEGSLNDSVSDAEEAVTQAASDMEDAVDNAFDEMKDDTKASDSTADTGSSYYDSGSFSSSEIYDENQGGKVGFAIGSLVCGCLSILCCCGGCCMFVLSAAAIVLGIMCIMKNLDGRGLAIAGIITGAVGLLLQIIFTIAVYANDGFSEIFGAL